MKSSLTNVNSTPRTSTSLIAKLALVAAGVGLAALAAPAMADGPRRGESRPDLPTPPIADQGTANMLADVTAADGLSDRADGFVTVEDLNAFILAFIEGGQLADVASNGADSEFNPDGTVGPEDLDAFIASYIANSGFSEP